MELPQFNTQSPDITNAVAQYNQARLQNAQARKIETDTALEPARNALLIAQEKRALAESQRAQAKADKEAEIANLEDTAKAMSWLQGLEGPQKIEGYKTLHKTLVSEFAATGGKKGMNPAYLYDPADVTKPEQIDSLASNAINATKLLQNPLAGKTFKLLQINPKFITDPTAPKYVEHEIGIGPDGKTKLLGTSAAAADPTASAEHADEMLEETKRHNLEMEKAAGNAEKRAAETERHNKAVEKIMTINAATGAARTANEDWFTVGPTEDKKALIMHNRKTGAVKVTPIPEGATLGAKPTDKKKGGRFSGIVSNTTLKPVTKDILNTFAATGKYKTKQEVLEAAKKEGYDTKGF
jgi:hypothetical protein